MPLNVTVTTLVTTHAFFTTWMGTTPTLAAKELLAAKLLLYEARGRPVNTAAADLTRLDTEWALLEPRPQVADSGTRVANALTRIAQAPYVPGERILRTVRAFPAIYWFLRHSSGTQIPWCRNVARAFLGESSPVTVSAADLARYATLRLQPNNGYACADIANLMMNYNAPDRLPSLPDYQLAHTPLF